jgi:hypothetical protein
MRLISWTLRSGNEQVQAGQYRLDSTTGQGMLDTTGRTVQPEQGMLDTTGRTVQPERDR